MRTVAKDAEFVIINVLIMLLLKYIIIIYTIQAHTHIHKYDYYLATGQSSIIASSVYYLGNAISGCVLSVIWT